MVYKGKKMLLPVLVLLISVLLTAGWMTPVHGEETSSEQTGGGIKIGYDSSAIHSVGNVILFCMNNQMHWPHDTETFKAPLYEEGYLTKDNFQRITGKTDYDTFIHELSVLLYAGYPYNGLGLFPVEGGDSESISEEDFLQMLIPSDRLRSDFPETLGKVEAGKPVEDTETLTAFMDALFKYHNSSNVTTSGMTYSDITRTAFYKAAFCVVNSPDPREAYEQSYLNENAYESTRNAIWQLMYEYGIPENKEMALGDKSRELLDTAKSGNVSILSAEPTSEQIGSVKIVGDTTFSKKTDGKWYTGELHVEEPENFHGAYTITLPEGTSLYEGSTLVKVGELFQLVSEKKPEGKKTVTVSAEIPWLKSVKMYSPVKNADQTEVTASDGKSFQHMVGAEIEKASVRAEADLNVSSDSENTGGTGENSTNPSNPTNPSTPTDPSTPVTPPNPVNPNGPVIPPNQENTSASEEPASPEHTVSRETPAANLPAASKKPTAVKKSEGNGKQKVSASVLPKTGDSLNVALWGLGLFVCGAAALGLLRLRIRNRREE